MADPKTQADLDKDYDTRKSATLTSRMNRDPKPSELVNAEYDSDLTTEILWQMFCAAIVRIAALEASMKKNGLLP